MLVIVGQLDKRQETTLFVGAETFSNKSKTPANVAKRLRLATAVVRMPDTSWLMVIPVPRFQVKSLTGTTQLETWYTKLSWLFNMKMEDQA